jgi:thiol-disulfide isomerase/thioredoxin
MKKTTRNYVSILVANALLLVVVGAVWQAKVKTGVFDPRTAIPANPDLPMPVPQKLPAASYKKNLTEPANLSDLTGQWTVLNLWASWCAPCVTEMPGLEVFAKDYENKGLRTVAISFDLAESPAEIRAHIDRLKFGKITMNWDDTGAVSNALNPEGLPTSYLIDPKGQIRLIMSGERDWAAADTRAIIDTYIQEK